EMLADDLPRRVPLDPLCARIPARDVAFGTELEDRVIGDALHKQPELFLTGAQRGLGLHAFGEVARDLGEADEVARTVPDRIDDDIGPEPGAVLADPPSLVLELPLAFGDLKRALGQARFPVFLGIKFGEGFAEDL